MAETSGVLEVLRLVDDYANSEEGVDAEWIHGRLREAGERVVRECREAKEATRRAAVLVRLFTVRQVVDAGEEALDAAGLNPWCLNEGLARGEDRLSPSWLP